MYSERGHEIVVVCGSQHAVFILQLTIFKRKICKRAFFILILFSGLSKASGTRCNLHFWKRNGHYFKVYFLYCIDNNLLNNSAHRRLQFTRPKQVTSGSTSIERSRRPIFYWLHWTLTVMQLSKPSNDRSFSKSNLPGIGATIRSEYGSGENSSSNKSGCLLEHDNISIRVVDAWKLLKVLLK